MILHTAYDSTYNLTRALKIHTFNLDTFASSKAVDRDRSSFDIYLSLSVVGFTIL